MAVLKTYARVWPTDLDAAVATYQTLTGRTEHLRFAFESVVIVGIADFLIIAGPRAEQDRYRAASATVVVDDLPKTLQLLGSEASTVTGPTGTFAYVTHDDGSQIEYVQWSAGYLAEVAGQGAFG